MVEWNRIFRLFRFSGILGQPREVLPKFRNEIPENVCSIRSPTRNLRNFLSNGKRPRASLDIPCSVNATFARKRGRSPLVLIIQESTEKKKILQLHISQDSRKFGK